MFVAAFVQLAPFRSSLLESRTQLGEHFEAKTAILILCGLIGSCRIAEHKRTNVPVPLQARFAAMLL
jgi:hypothetical protein